MSELLSDMHVLVLDCQASGASPAYGDLLELGWARCAPEALADEPRNHWVLPRSERRVARAVRELTGWSEACLADALPEQEVWQALSGQIAALSSTASATTPTVIHYARFELPFLRDLHGRLEPERAFPLDVLCVHEVAARLFPELPRRNIRALAGHLGHSTELLRRTAGHVQATAFIWRALVPLLAERGIHTWSELRAWLGSSARPARPARRRYPLSPALRRALPDRPGVYRFVRRNHDVLYVGKAASLKARVASHFAGHARANERSLEMLTQVADIDYTETASVLEAALLECDEIKRIDPPYNIHLRSTGRSTWFAASDLRDASATPDATHHIGPLPSRLAGAPLAALRELARGEHSRGARAWALGVPGSNLPEDALFREGFALFAGEHLAPDDDGVERRIDRAARSLWLARGRSEPETSSEDLPPDGWDLARVRRRLERNLVQAGLVLRRARFLCLLADADVIFRESKMAAARLLVLAAGKVEARHELPTLAELATFSPRKPPALQRRQASLDIAAYDRLRVLATELRRIQDEGGEVSVRIGRHTFAGARFAQLTREL